MRETQGIRVKCPKCGYVWHYKGKRLTVTCPNCRSTVKTNLNLKEGGGNKE